MKRHVVLSVLTACCLALSAAGCSAGAEYDRYEKTVLSRRDVYRLFGDLPICLDLGSFALNRLNHVPSPIIQDQYLMYPDKAGVYTGIRPSFSTLQTSVSQILSECQGDWSIYIRSLTTGETISLNEHPMQSASLIKLFIAGTVLEQIEQGKLTETDSIRESLRQMIVVSSNEAANYLVSVMAGDQGFQAGMDKVNDFCNRYGFTNTSQLNGLADPTYWINPGYNITSTADCARFLELVYHHKLISHYASYRLEELLNHQEVNYKIPSALPEGTPIAHKTGEISDTENNVAIIYTPQGDYILSIMSTELNDTGSAVETIRRLTRLVHGWFTTPVRVYDPRPVEASAETGNN